MVKVGTLKKLKIQHLGNKIGSIAVCFDRHQSETQILVSFIFLNGEYDVFSITDTNDEINHFFEDWSKNDSSLSSYRYKNREQLIEDFECGKFNRGFNI